MKRTFTAFLLISCYLSVKCQPVDSVSGPRVWLRADRGILGAAKWSDVSVFKNDASAASAQQLPTLNGTINFNKAVTFDGIDDYLKIPYSLEGLADLSIFAVFQSADTTERGIWGTEQGSSRNILLTTRKAIGPDTIADAYGKSEKIAVLNSVLQNWEKATTTSSTAFFALGSAGKTKSYKPFKGVLAELAVFNRSLTFLERVQFETYLAIKYGTGLRGGNFVSSGEKVLWRVEENKGYGRNIAGIGRDDAFQLYQKQSGSAYDSGLLLMSAGALAASNMANTAVIADQDFLLWGDNGLPLNARKGVGADSVLSMVQRKWLVTATGNTANKLPVELRIDAAKFPSNPLGYWLVIDRSGQGNFSVDNLEYILPDAIADGKVIYKNVMWDKDGSGKDNFGFAKATQLFAVVRRVSDPSCTNETAGKIRIEVVAGQVPFQYSLTNPEAKIARDWKTAERSTDQKELVKGNYKLALSDGGDEALIRNFTLVMPDGLDINLGPDQVYSETSNIVLDVSAQVPATVPVTYRWENNFGYTSTDRKITVEESGIYRVFVTKDVDGCVFTDDVTISGAEAQRVAVYPNIISSNENYNVSVSLNKPGSVVVKVFNARGMQVQEMANAGRSEFQFITSLKDTGMYVVVIQTPQGVETRKVIVQ